MATFLTTEKMSAALRARVEASVRNGHPGPGRSRRHVGVSVIRLAAVAVAVGLSFWTVSLWTAAKERVEQARKSLLEDVRRRSAPLTPAERDLPSRVVELIAAQRVRYEGDRVAPSLREPGSLPNTLAQPLLYVRAAIDGETHPVALAEQAAASFRDAFSRCFVDPPASRDERTLRTRALAALAGGTMARDATRLERLHDALLGLPFLAPEWAARVRQADRAKEIERLRAALGRAPVDGAVRAARATLLLSVLDEPNDGTGPTELDGECPHHVRVELYDLRTDTSLLRMRRHVDPKWIAGEASRAQYARGMDGCKLALEIRDELAGLRKPAGRRVPLVETVGAP